MCARNQTTSSNGPSVTPPDAADLRVPAYARQPVDVTLLQTDVSTSAHSNLVQCTSCLIPALPARPALGSSSTVIYCIYSTDCQKRTPVMATASTPAAPSSRSRLDPTFEKTDSASQASTFRPPPLPYKLSFSVKVNT